MCIHNNNINDTASKTKLKKLTNSKIVTFDNDRPYGQIDDGALVIDRGLIAWVGATKNLPTEYNECETINLEERLITPALIDCHTHIVHGGHRAAEFEMRLQGASYEDVARAGGGIVSTVSATRNASLDQMLQSALPRVDALISEGVSLVEIKSGYGLDTETELNMLRAARRIEQTKPIRVVTSFLGAHAIPREYKGQADQYIDEVCIPTLKIAHEEKLVDYVDGFCEGIAFSPEQIERVFTAAKSLGLPVKLHAEQLSHLGGVQLAARYGAVSADHVEYANEDDAKAMALAGTVAVLLPGAFYTVRETQIPPIDAFRVNGVAMALATDCNPGSSPMTSLLLAMNMACTLFHMTPEEALAGITKNAAKALGLQDTGIIKAGMRADLAVWNVEGPAELAYRIGFNPLHQRIFGGQML